MVQNVPPKGHQAILHILANWTTHLKTLGIIKESNPNPLHLLSSKEPLGGCAR